MSIEDILDELHHKLTRLDEVKKQIENITRKIIQETKRAIFLTHREDFESAKSKLNEIEESISELNRLIEQYPEFRNSSQVNVAFQEFAEATFYLNLIEEGRYVEPEDIEITPTQYLLGLTDCVGEMRRRVLDLIREGRVAEAEKTLRIMDEIYSQLSIKSDLQILVHGLRRKCDIARKIVELTRGDVTIEVRRNALEKAIKRMTEELRRDME